MHPKVLHLSACLSSNPTTRKTGRLLSHSCILYFINLFSLSQSVLSIALSLSFSICMSLAPSLPQHPQGLPLHCQSPLFRDVNSSCDHRQQYCIGCRRPRQHKFREEQSKNLPLLLYLCYSSIWIYIIYHDIRKLCNLLT